MQIDSFVTWSAGDQAAFAISCAITANVRGTIEFVVFGARATTPILTGVDILVSLTTAHRIMREVDAGRVTARKPEAKKESCMGGEFR